MQQTVTAAAIPAEPMAATAHTSSSSKLNSISLQIDCDSPLTEQQQGEGDTIVLWQVSTRQYQLQVTVVVVLGLRSLAVHILAWCKAGLALAAPCDTCLGPCFQPIHRASSGTLGRESAEAELGFDVVLGKWRKLVILLVLLSEFPAESHPACSAPMSMASQYSSRLQGSGPGLQAAHLSSLSCAHSLHPISLLDPLWSATQSTTKGD